MNAILGMDRLPTGVVSLTSVVTLVAYGREDKAVLHYRGTRLFMDIPLERLGSWRRISWRFVPLGVISAGIDPRAPLFVLATGAVGLPVSIFPASYLPHYAHRYDLRYSALLYHLFLAAMVGVLIARDVLSFLLAWEAMSVLSYLLVAFESDSDPASYAGSVMLAMSEAGMMLVVVALLLLTNAVGSTDFAADPSRRAQSRIGTATARPASRTPLPP